MVRDAPAISILLPVRNGGLWIADAIRSVQNQSVPDFQLVVVDDHSTDDTERQVKSLSEKDPRIEFRPNKGPAGLVSTLNFGLQHSEAAFVARLDADDVMNPNRLATHLEILKDPRIALVGSNVQRFSLDTPTVTSSHLPTGQRRIGQWLKSGRSPFAHPAVTFRRDAVLKVGGYDSSFPHAEDFELWCRLRKVGRLVNTRQALTRYRIHEQQVSQVHGYTQQLSTLRAARYHFPEASSLLGFTKNKHLSDPDLNVLASILRGCSASVEDLSVARPELLFLESTANEFRRGVRILSRGVAGNAILHPTTAVRALLVAMPYLRRSAFHAIGQTRCLTVDQ